MARGRARLADDEPVRPQRRAGVAPRRRAKLDFEELARQLRASGAVSFNHFLLKFQRRERRAVRVHGLPRRPGDHQGDQRRGQGADAVREVRRALTAGFRLHVRANTARCPRRARSARRSPDPTPEDRLWPATTTTSTPPAAPRRRRASGSSPACWAILLGGLGRPQVLPRVHVAGIIMLVSDIAPGSGGHHRADRGDHLPDEERRGVHPDVPGRQEGVVLTGRRAGRCWNRPARRVGSRDRPARNGSTSCNP